MAVRHSPLSNCCGDALVLPIRSLQCGENEKDFAFASLSLPCNKNSWRSFNAVMKMQNWSLFSRHASIEQVSCHVHVSCWLLLEMTRSESSYSLLSVEIHADWEDSVSTFVCDHSQHANLDVSTHHRNRKMRFSKQLLTLKVLNAWVSEKKDSP